MVLAQLKKEIRDSILSMRFLVSTAHCVILIPLGLLICHGASLFAAATPAFLIYDVR